MTRNHLRACIAGAAAAWLASGILMALSDAGVWGTRARHLQGWAYASICIGAIVLAYCVVSALGDRG